MARTSSILTCIIVMMIGMNMVWSQTVSWRDRGKFADAAFRRLQNAASPQELEPLNGYISEWNKTRSEDLWVKCRNEISTLASEKSVLSKVRITTLNAARLLPGASVRYQLAGDTIAREAKELTSCDETMVIGYYFFWSERNGQQTSRKKGPVAIVGVNEFVELEETQDVPSKNP